MSLTEVYTFEHNITNSKVAEIGVIYFLKSMKYIFINIWKLEMVFT